MSFSQKDMSFTKKDMSFDKKDMSFHPNDMSFHLKDISKNKVFRKVIKKNSAAALLSLTLCLSSSFYLAKVEETVLRANKISTLASKKDFGVGDEKGFRCGGYVLIGKRHVFLLKRHVFLLKRHVFLLKRHVFLTKRHVL